MDDKHDLVELKSSLLLVVSGPAAVLTVFCGLAVAALLNQAATIRALNTVLWEAKPDTQAARMRWWRMQAYLWRIAWKRGVKAILERTVRVAVLGMLSGFGGLLATMVIALPALVTRNIIDRPAPGGAGTAFLVGAVLSVVTFGKCLRYLVGRSPARGLLSGPDFRLVDKLVPLRARMLFNQRVYLYAQLRWAAIAAGSLGPSLVVGALTDGGFPPSQPPSPSSELEWTPEVQAGFLVIVSLVLGLFVTTRLIALIEVVLAPVHSAVVIHQCLQDSDSNSEAEVGWAPEPLGAKRRQLQVVVQALQRSGQRLDRASSGHPLASVVLGCSHHLRRFLTGADALTTQYPAGLATLLTEAQVVQAGLAAPDRAVALGALVGAFGQNGQPIPELRAKLPRRWAVLLGRTGESLDRLSRYLTAGWTSFTIVVVVVLIATKQLDLTSFQLQK